MIKIAEKFENETVEMRKVYTATLIELAKENENIVALDADLMSAIAMGEFNKTYPDRFINCGIQEANMIGVAAGMSATGKIPFAHTFAPFATRRAYDQLFLSAGYAQLNVKVVGSDPGITAQLNGGTHMPFEDVGLMRMIPNAVVCEPTDNTILKFILKEAASRYGLFYIRLSRKQSTKIYDETSTFEFGKANTIREGKDVTIIAYGIMVKEALIAADMLKAQGIDARVIDMFMIKPIDKEAIIKAAKETGAIVTAENHNIIGGLGEATAAVLAENIPVPLERVGVNDVFGKVGKQDYLAKEFKLTAEEIVSKVQKVLKRK